MGKSTINIYKWPFSIAMLVYQRVSCFWRDLSHRGAPRSSEGRLKVEGQSKRQRFTLTRKGLMNWWHFEKQTYNTTYIYIYLYLLNIYIYIYISISIKIYLYKYISIYPFFNLFHLSHSHDTCPWFVGNKLTFLHNIFIVVGFVPGIIRYYEYKPTECWHFLAWQETCAGCPKVPASADVKSYEITKNVHPQ